MTTETWSAAFQRFADALNQGRDAALLAAAVSDDIRVTRHKPGERGAAPVAELFSGVAEVAGWLARTPVVARFTLVGTPWPDASDATAAWGVEYAIDAGEFHNGGIWVARLAEDGRITVLSHHPFALRDPQP